MTLDSLTGTKPGIVFKIAFQQRRVAMASGIPSKKAVWVVFGVLNSQLLLCHANDGTQTLGHIFGGRGPRRYADPHGHMPMPLCFSAPAGAVFLDFPDDASGLFITAEFDWDLV